MQKIVLFVEETFEKLHPTNLIHLSIPFKIPSKIGKLFMNRFAIDEDENFEILKIIKVESKSSRLGGLGGLGLLEPGKGYNL